jgi:uncharacterized phiE125 gp8 family phage protein
MRVVVVKAPAAAVLLGDAKAHLRVDGDEEDFLIAGMIDAAIAHIDGPDGWLGRAIGVQTLEAYLPAPALIGRTLLPCRPIVEVVAVEARSAAGWHIVDPSTYEQRGDWVVFGAGAQPLTGWVIGDPEAMRIRYRAGYTDIPAPIRQAVLIMTESMYRNRGSADFVLPAAARALLGPYRVFS